MSEKKKRRVPLPVKALLAVAATAIVAGGAAAGKLYYEQSAMRPLATGELLPGVYAVDSGRVNCYLIAGDGGYVMVDTGADREGTLAALDALGVSPDEVKTLLLTSADDDHAASVPFFPDARAYIARDAARLLERGGEADSAYQTIEHGERLNAYGIDVECVSPFGLEPGSVCYLLNDKHLFTGDAVSFKYGGGAPLNLLFNREDASRDAGVYRALENYGPAYVFTSRHGYTGDTEAELRGWRAASGRPPIRYSGMAAGIIAALFVLSGTSRRNSNGLRGPARVVSRLERKGSARW